jgi:23S rRNA (guanine745-N1)-methyltransferase
VAAASGSCVVELGAGTGYYLARVLSALPESIGLALDSSRPAVRRALQASPRIAAVACDVWEELPLRDGAADLVLDVFAPRNGSEIARVLSPEGTLIVVTPTPRHLTQLAELPGMVRVDERKEERLAAELSPWLESAGRRELEFEMSLGGAEVRALVEMGPSAHHVDSGAVAGLPDPLAVTASVTIETFRRG